MEPGQFHRAPRKARSLTVINTGEELEETAGALRTPYGTQFPEPGMLETDRHT
jgi:hypothetical protein